MRIFATTTSPLIDKIVIHLGPITSFYNLKGGSTITKTKLNDALIEERIEISFVKNNMSKRLFMEKS